MNRIKLNIDRIVLNGFDIRHKAIGDIKKILEAEIRKSIEREGFPEGINNLDVSGISAIASYPGNINSSFQLASVLAGNINQILRRNR